MAQQASVDILINAKDNASKEISKVQGSLGGLSNSFASVVKAGAVAAAGLGVAAGAMGAKLAMSAVQGASSVEQQTVAFTTLLGSADKAKEALAGITEDAKKTPFELAGLIQGNMQLIAAGVSAEDARKDFLGLGNAVAAVGKGQPELDRLASNLQQIKAVGKASTMDIRQFGNAGLPIFEMLADSMGVSKDKITELAEQGKIGYGEITKAMNDARQEGGKFHNALENQSQTFAGVVSNIKDNFNITMSAIAKDSGLFDAVKNAANSLLDAMDANQEKVKEFAKEFVQSAIPVLMNTGKWLFETGKKAYEMGQSFVNGLKLLEEKTGVFSMLRTSVMYVVDAVMNNLIPALANNKDLFAAIGATIVTVAGYLGSFLITAIAIAVNVISGLLNVVASATDFFVRHKDAIKDLAIALTIVLSPAIVLIGIVLASMAISAVAAFGAWAIAAGAAVVSTLLLFASIIAIGALIAFTAFAIIHWWDKIKIGAALMGKAMVESFNWIGAKLAWLVGAFVNTTQFVGNALAGLVGKVISGFNAIGNFLASLVAGFVRTANMIGSALQGMVGFVVGAFNKVSNIVNGVFNTIVDTVRGYIGKFMQVGSDIIQGLIQGITNGRDAVINVMKGIASGAIDTVKNFLGIHSPSVVFKQIGENTVQGLINGVTNKKEEAKNALMQVAQAMNTAFTSALSIRADAQGSIVKDIVDAKENLAKTTAELNGQRALPADQQDASKISELENTQRTLSQFLERHKKDQTDLTAFIKKEEEFRSMDSIQQTKFRMNEQLKEVQDGLKAQINAFKKAFKDLSNDKEIKKLFGGVDNFAKIFGNFGTGVSVKTIPGFAGGVENFSGGIAMVGENGPEMVRLPRGASVTPNHELGSVGGGIHIENHFHNAVVRQESDFEKIASMVKQSINRDAQLANKGI